jgi:NAD(P)-dependent dehydrogenase (short-subunit alcohol dehydrogenase family)
MSQHRASVPVLKARWLSSPARPRASAAAWRWRRRAKARNWCWPTVRPGANEVAPKRRAGALAIGGKCRPRDLGRRARPGENRPGEFGRIDMLVNNVGGTIWAKPFQEYEEEQIEAEIRRSLFPTLWCCRAVLPR